MHYVDIVLLVLFVAFAISGANRGLIKEFFLTIGLVAGIFFASRYALVVGEMVPISNASDGMVKLIGFSIVFAAVFAFSFLLGTILKDIRFAKGAPFVSNQIHLFGGSVFGMLRLFFILSVVVYMLSSTKKIGDLMQKNFSDSIAYAPLKSSGSKIVKLDLSLESVKDRAEDIVDEMTEIGVEFTKDKIGEQ